MLSTASASVVHQPARKSRRKDYELTDDERALVARWLDPKSRREQLTSQIWGRDTLNLLVWPIWVVSAAFGIVWLVSFIQEHLGWPPWVRKEDQWGAMTFVLVVYWIFDLTRQLLDQQITVLKFIESRESDTPNKTAADA